MSVKTKAPRKRRVTAPPPTPHLAGAPAGHVQGKPEAAALVMELPIFSPGTQAYTCAVSCAAGCCKYYSLPLERPTTDRDFDDIRWYLMHEDSHVYKHEGAWYLLVLRRCKYLRPDNLCGNYDHRPEICREYDPTDCEFTGEVDYELYFRNDHELEAWLIARKAARKRKRA